MCFRKKLGLTFCTLLIGHPLLAQSPFGIGSCHIQGRSVKDYKNWLPAIRDTGIRFNRSLMSHWGSIEPKPGQWSWGNADAQWKYLHDHGFTTGTLLIGNPSWNKKDPPGNLPVNNLDGWSEYVSQTTAHFKGRITRYEVWNEPPNFTGRDQAPADYAKLVRAAYLSAKKSDPTSEIGLTTKSAHLVYLEQVIHSGAAGHYDWISVHPYEILDGIANDTGLEPLYMNIVPTLRKMLASADPSKKNVPIVFTELGTDASRHGELGQSYALLKAYLLGIAQGVENIQWFEGRDGDSGPMGLIDGKGRPRAAYHAYQKLIETLGHQPRYLGHLVFGEATAYGFLFKTEKGTVLAAWAPKKNKHTLTFKTPITFLNPTSGAQGKVTEYQLSLAPIFFLNPPDTLTSQAKNTPLPWPNDPHDYSGEKEISIDYSRPIPERGLHTRSGDAVSSAIKAYGGSARAGDAPGGNLFIVDPAFLSYHTIPLTITAEVRRKDPAITAGFKLIYESPTGFKTAAGWQNIPDDDQWHTFTWKINDSRFVSYWGYNFRLESDGKKFSQYHIRRISVRKE